MQQFGGFEFVVSQDQLAVMFDNKKKNENEQTEIIHNLRRCEEASDLGLPLMNCCTTQSAPQTV